MMALIESLQQKAVEEGADDANECGDGDSEDNDGELAKEEDDISLNEDEQASAEEKKMECQIGNSDVNADGSVKTVAEIKEGDQQPMEHKGDPEEGKDATMNRTSAAQVVDGLVEEGAVEEMRKSSKEVDNNESQQPQKRKGDDADIGADGTKRIKTSASMDETAVSGGTVQHIRKSGEE
jgi:E3 ubiquitin-protein ligase UHRF1